MVCIAFFIAPLFAINQFSIDDNVLKIGSYVEMLIISLVVARMRILQDENQQMYDEIIAKSIDTYNNERPHLSLNMKTPSFIHKKSL